MAEIGIVASIIGVASAGFRLSLILNAISCEVAQAPLEIHHISKTVTLFSLMLKQTGTVLQAADSVHSHDAVQAAKQVADESNRVFDEINEMLDKVRTKKDDGTSKPSVQQRIKWCFKKSRITYLLGQLDSLKMSVSLMLQILQLGKLMASTSRRDPPEIVKEKSLAIQQERAETQNTLIVRYMQVSETEMYYQEYKRDETGRTSPIEYRNEPDTDNDSQVTIKAPVEPTVSITTLQVTRLQCLSLGDVDDLLQEMCNSSKDMVRISDRAIDPLLEKWTRWHEIRDLRHSKPSNGRYTPSVHSLQEDDVPYFERYTEREESPRGYYLEGSTTDWRQPNSIVARQEFARRKKQYAGYQPSVSAQSSDQEDSPASNASSKRNTKRHVINSSSDSSDSEVEAPKKKPPVRFQPGPPLERSAPIQPTSNQSTPPGQQLPFRMPPTPAQSVGSKTTASPQYVTPPAGRPYATPDQNMYNHHSVSMPLPPIYTHNAPNPYAQASPQSPAYTYPPYHNQSAAQPPHRQYPTTPNRISIPNNNRPISRDGRGGRSPSRLSQEMPRDFDWEREPDRNRDRYYDKGRDIDRDRDRDRIRDRDRDRDHGRHEKKPRESKTKVLREGATKGLLGAGAISIFLEALEGLDV